MAFIGWIISIAAFLAGLAAHQQPFALPIEPIVVERGLYAMALLSFPPFWAKESGLLSWTGVSRGMRVSACLAALLAIPGLYFQG